MHQGDTLKIFGLRTQERRRGFGSTGLQVNLKWSCSWDSSGPALCSLWCLPMAFLWLE